MPNAPQPKTRKIENKKFNRFVGRDDPKHKKSELAPGRLYDAIPAHVAAALQSKQKQLEARLKQALGKPYFSENGFILYRGDCCDFLQQLQKTDVSFDLVVTSPPYNLGKEYEKNRSVEAYINWCATWMNAVYLSTRNAGSFWLNLGYLEVPEKGLCVPIPYLLWDKSPFYLIQEVVWHYGAGVATRKRLSPRNEKWLFYVKDKKNYTFNLDDIRDPNVKYPHQKKNGKFRCNPLGKNPSDVWIYPKVTTGKKRRSKERTGHPAQFPLGVVERIVRASSHSTQVVLDPFAGSCPVGIASVGTGRLFVGFELRKDYCDISIERYKAFLSEKHRKMERQSPP